MKPQRARLERFVQVFGAAALQAGALARHLQGEVAYQQKEEQDSPESSALSAADLAAQDVLLLRLAEHFADVAMDAEEDTETTGLFGPGGGDRPVIVVDPIDGTFNYLRGSRDYAVMGAWLEGGVYQASVVYYPTWRQTYWAIAGAGCYRRADGGADEPVSVAGALPNRVLVPPRTPRPVHDRITELGFEVELCRCSAIDSAAPALGRAAGAANAGPPDRRRAIGFLLATEAGAHVLCADGPWAGRDPDAGAALGAHAVAATRSLAGRLLDAARG